MECEIKRIKEDISKCKDEDVYSRIHIDIKTGKVTIGELRKLK